MEPWRKVWRDAVAPLLSGAELSALAEGLARDDPSLVQGCNTTPSPLSVGGEWDCAGACPLGYCGWKGGGLATVGEVEEYVARVCRGADARAGEVGAVRHLFRWIDATHRDRMRRELLPEVRLAMEAHHA